MLLVITFLVLTACGFVAFFLWYLTWPVVDGKAIDVTTHVTPKAPHTRARESRIACYDYRYGGVDYRSIRQGLITVSSLAPRVNAGDTIRVSVCTRRQSLSCPRRVRFEATVMLIAVLVCTWGIVLSLDVMGAISI